MTFYHIPYGDKVIEVRIYKTKWIMHSASIRYKKSGTLTSTSHKCAGLCSRWWITPYKPNKVVSLVMMSWDTINIEILSHELLHAAVHLWTYDKEESGKMLSTENDEELAYIHSDLICDLLSLFNDDEKQKLILNKSI